MNKIAAIFISILYLLVSVGVAVDIHSCEGEIQNIGLFGSDNKCCCPDDDSTLHCCKDESVFVQFYNDQQLVKQQVKIPLNTLVTINNQAVNINTKNPAVLKEKFNVTSLAKPPPKKHPIWLVTNSLIYYG